MSIALDRSSNRIKGSGFIHGMSCVSIFESPSPEILIGDRRFQATSGDVVEEQKEDNLDSCTSSSSIGKNSDLSGTSSDGEDSGETEVQSSYKQPFDSMDALEEVLPIRRGMSRFYNGKSKSFASLTEASSTSSIKDIAKPENAYTRKRRNLLASSLVWDKNRNFPLRSNGGGISKRPANLSRSTLALAVAMSSSESDNNICEDSNLNLNSQPPSLLPPLHPQARPSHNNVCSSPPPPRRSFSPWRSFSLADLQQCDTAATTNTLPSLISDKDELK